MATYDKMTEYAEKDYGKVSDYEDIWKYRKASNYWQNSDQSLSVKIKCDNVIEFIKYMEELQQDNDFFDDLIYCSLESQEKTIYISIIELILKVMMIVIIVIGIISTINTINASLIERKEDFKVMYRVGATKEDIKKMLIYEGVYMFIKALVISIILSIPIVYAIIKYMKKIVIFNELFIPFGSIAIFIGMLFAITLAITIYSTKMIEED